MRQIYLDKLREHDLKLTPRRLAIIDFFLKKRTYLTPERVWKNIRREMGRCGLPTVYRNLEQLSQCGILTKIQRFDRKRHYGLCTIKGDRHHHHIVCVKCGKVGEVECPDLFKHRRVAGFRVVGHFVQLEGVCSDCR